MSVFLASVDVMGKVSSETWPMPASQATSAYNRVLARVYEPDPRLRATVHAIREGHDQRRPDSDHIQSDVGHAPDRSCREGWCVCKEVGLPERTHPHLATA